MDEHTAGSQENKHDPEQQDFHRDHERPERPARPWWQQYKWVLAGGVVVVAAVTLGVILLSHKDNDQAASVSGSHGNTRQLSLAETGYTGVAADVLTNQTFKCEPRNDHEWYRTDRTLTVDPKNPNIMYVSVEWKGLFKTTDAGASWKQITKGIKVYARDDDKTKGCYSEYPVLRIDPADSKHLVLGASGPGGGYLNPTEANAQVGGVYQSYDGGASWKLMINNHMNVYVTDVAIDPTDGNTVYYGTTSNPASYQEADQSKRFVKDGLIYQTKDAGKTWKELPTGIGDHSGIMRIFINPVNTEEIVGPTYTAVRQSADGTGTGISTGKDTSVPQLGVFHTTDGGSTWPKTTLPGNPATSRAYNSPTNFQHMYFVPETQGSTPSGYVSLDGAKTFKAVKYMDVVAYDPFDASGNHAIAFSVLSGTPTTGITMFETQDGGLNWQTRGTVPGEIKNANDTKTRPSNIIWHPTDKNTLYMSGAGGHVWKSTDLGQTWTTLLDYSKLPK